MPANQNDCLKPKSLSKTDLDCPQATFTPTVRLCAPGCFVFTMDRFKFHSKLQKRGRLASSLGETRTELVKIGLFNQGDIK